MLGKKFKSDWTYGWHASRTGVVMYYYHVDQGIKFNSDYEISFLVTFGAHLAPKMDAFGPTFGQLSRLFGPLVVDMWRFFTQGCWGRVLGSILGVTGVFQDGFGKDFA